MLQRRFAKTGICSPDCYLGLISASVSIWAQAKRGGELMRFGSHESFLQLSSTIMKRGPNERKLSTTRKKNLSRFKFNESTWEFQARLVPSRYLYVFGMRVDWIREWIEARGGLWEGTKAKFCLRRLIFPRPSHDSPRASTTLVSNLISSQKHINSDWVLVWFQAKRFELSSTHPRLARALWRLYHVIGTVTKLENNSTKIDNKKLCVVYYRALCDQYLVRWIISNESFDL